MRRLQILVLVVLLASGTAVLLAGRPMTVEDTLAIRNLSGISWSPDGRYILYTVDEWDRENNRRVSHVYRSGLEPGDPVQLTRGEKGESSPQVSPDGSKLAFLANRDEKTQVWILPMTGGESYPLTDAKESVSGFEWMPDSSGIAYTVGDRYPDHEDREKRKKDKFDAVVVDRDFLWAHLWMIDLAKRNATRLTEGDFNVSAFEPSPDGRSIAYQRTFNGRQESSWRHIDDRQDSELWVLDMATKQSSRVASEFQRVSGPSWSGDGKHLAFTAATGVTSGDIDHLVILEVATGAIRNLTAADSDSVGRFQWHPKGGSIFYSQGKQVYSQLFEVPLNGQAIRKVSGRRGITRSGFRVAPDGSRIAFGLNDPDKPSDLWIASTSDMQPVQLTSLNPQVSEIDVSETRVVQWPSSDGLTIEGILTLPVGYQEGTRYPLILSIHGGPTGASTHMFSARNQVFAGLGYAILQPNPRGSTNYGNEFVNANNKDWGGGDFHDDDMGGVDKVIEMGVADPDRLVVMGGSYGGFSTFWSVTQTDRFKAAIGHAAISDWYSFYGQTDIPQYLKWGFGGHPWETREVYEKFSPYNFATNVKTPLMITHGEQDRRVPIAQAEQYYTLLKKLGVEVDFVRYPREGHGIREPNHVIDLVGRQIEWFDRHLGIQRTGDTAPTGSSGSSGSPR